MWHLKTSMVPVIVEALGMIKKRTNIKKIAGSFSLYEIQQIALRRVLSM